MTGDQLNLNIVINLKDNVKMEYYQTVDIPEKVIIKLLTSGYDEICFAPQRTIEWAQLGGIKKWVSYSMENDNGQIDELVCYTFFKAKISYLSVLGSTPYVPLQIGTRKSMTKSVKKR